MRTGISCLRSLLFTAPVTGHKSIPRLFRDSYEPRCLPPSLPLLASPPSSSGRNSTYPSRACITPLFFLPPLSFPPSNLNPLHIWVVHSPRGVVLTPAVSGDSARIEARILHELEDIGRSDVKSEAKRWERGWKVRGELELGVGCDRATVDTKATQG